MTCHPKYFLTFLALGVSIWTQFKVNRTHKYKDLLSRKNNKEEQYFYLMILGGVSLTSVRLIFDNY